MRYPISGLFLATLLIISSLAIADPAVELIWHSTTGSGTPGTSSIEADKNDILELDIIVRDFDGQGIIGALVDRINWDSTDVVVTAAQDCPSPPYLVPDICNDPLTTVNLEAFLGEILGPTYAGPFDAYTVAPLNLPAFFGPFNPMTLGRLTLRVDARGLYTFSTEYFSGSGVINGAEKLYVPDAEATIVPPGCG